MDINMGGINGIEASRRIHEAHPDVCVVLLSTYPADDLPADALAQGAAAYINKDEFGPQVLQTTWKGRPGSESPAWATSGPINNMSSRRSAATFARRLTRPQRHSRRAAPKA